jgi:hypothetical protein
MMPSMPGAPLLYHSTVLPQGSCCTSRTALALV